MDHYETTFFGHEKGNDKIIAKLSEKQDTGSYWPFKLRLRTRDDKPLITFHFATFMEIYEFVQSVKESYEKLLAGGKDE